MPCLPHELRQCATGPVRRRADGSLSMRFTFPPEFSGFAGHFPGQPILPGVVQVMAGALCASEGRSTRLEGLSRAKFLLPIGAGATVEVVAGPVTNGKSTLVLELDGETASSMTLILNSQDGAA